MNNICFDARMAHSSGIGTYIRGLLGEMARNLPPDVSLTLITGSSNGVPHTGRAFPVSAKIYSIEEQLSIPWAFRRSGAEILHVPHYNLPVVLSQHCVVTVHDLIYVKFREYLPSSLAY